MRELPEYIASQREHIDSERYDHIRAKCDGITETIVLIVQDFKNMDAKFTKYLRDKQYDTVKMKSFRQGPNGYSGGKFVKYGTLFGGVQSLSLWSFLHRIYDVFLVPWDEAITHYPPRRLYEWPDAAAIPENFRYRVRERLPTRQVENPSGENQWKVTQVAVPLRRDDLLEEHGQRSDSSGEERHDHRDVRDVRDSVRTWHFGNDRQDSDDELDPVVEAAHRIVTLNRPITPPSDDDDVVAGSRRVVTESDEDGHSDVDLNEPFWPEEGVRTDARLTTMLHDLKQLSLS